MKLRLKEFLPYIIAMFVMFIFMIFASVVYSGLVNDTLRNSIYSNVSGEANKQATSFHNLVSQKKASFLNDESSYSTVTLTNSSFKHNNYDYFIASEQAVENNNSDTYYVYILTDEVVSGETTTSTYFKVKASTMIEEVYKNEYAFAFALIDETGAVYAQNGLGYSTVFEIMNDSISTTDIEKENMKTTMTDSKESYSTVCKFKNVDYYASVSRLGEVSDNDSTSASKVYVYDAKTNEIVIHNLYMFVLFDQVHFNQAISQTSNLTLFYRLIIIVTLILIVIDVSLSIFRANRIFAIGRRTAAKRGTAVIKVTRKGKVKYYGRGRSTFGIEVYDFSLFRPIDGKTFADALKHDNRFVCEYDLDSDSVGYAQFISIPQNGGYTVIASVVTDEYKKQLQVKNLIEQNSITHLPNRNAFIQNFEANKKTLFGEQVTLAFIRILEFQDVNRQFGFKAGDALIKNSLEVIKSCLTDYELYQDNNDTLLVLLKGNYSSNDDILTKITKSFNKPIEITNYSTILVHVRIGSYELKDVMNKSFNIDDAINKATQALRRALEQVSVFYVKYDLNLSTYLAYKEVMERDMHYALTHDEFIMYYQPQFNIKRNRIEGFESLIRWKSDKYATVSPQVYIEIAERNGDIVEIGRIINFQVCKAAKFFELYGVHLSINVSPAQLMQSGFIDELLAEVKKNELKAGSICVEITETYIMKNFSEMIDKLNILKGAGISIHLDDFGTGYSSMLYLKQLPISCIKTDKGFIDNLVSDESSRVIEKTIITMANELGLETIVEGVETKEQVALLQDFGADFLQGYIISRPVPFEKAMELVKNGVHIEGLKEKGGSFDV